MIWTLEQTISCNYKHVEFGKHANHVTVRHYLEIGCEIENYVCKDSLYLTGKYSLVGVKNDVGITAEEFSVVVLGPLLDLELYHSPDLQAYFLA